jgi:hypothetical protein
VTLVTTSSPPLQTVTPLTALNPVFDEWRNALAAFSRVVLGDLPWWYNETAAVGFLAAAAWRAGGVAIVEFDSERSDKDARRFRGRCDLYLALSGAAYYAEAKQTFHWLSESVDYVGAVADVQGRLDEATAQLEVLQCEPEAGQLALVFASPRLKASDADNLNDWLTRWRAALRMVKNAAMYTYFDVDRALDHPGEKDCIYPGIALFVREVRSCHS